MALTEKDIKNISVAVFIFLLGVVVFFLVKPLIVSIIAGLILAYICYPLHKILKNQVRSSVLSASIVSVLLLLVVIIPLWFMIPMLIKQIFNIVSALQSVNFISIVNTVFPSAPQEVAAQISLSINSFISKASESVLGFLADSLLELPTVALHLVIIAFVFFFTLKDSVKLKEFVSGLSPFNKNKEGFLIRQFKDITNSIIYGNIAVGLVQGVFAGLGFFLFGVNNAIALTVMAIFFAMIPLVGPAVIWLPVNIYLFTSSNPAVAIAYLVYNLAVVSTVDNVVRSYVVSRSSKVSPAIVTIGIVGGVFLFGILGIVIGPLLLVYFIMFLKAYREKKLYDLFFEA